VPIRRRTSALQPREELDLRKRLDEISVSIGIPAYNEGPGIVHTLESALRSLKSLGLGSATVVLSDSSENTSTVDSARAWANASGMHLVVDRSERRRSEKEARNVLMARASSDILVQIDADVVLPPGSLAHLLRCLTQPPAPLVAIGIAVPDPEFRGRAHRAGAWQLNATRRYASWLPVDAVRAEGAYWGAWRSFYRGYRLPIGRDSPHADICLAHHVEMCAIPTRNCWRAVVYKIPPATLNDFFLQTQRWYAARGARKRSWMELAAAVAETVRDPRGAAMYGYARMWAAREQRRRRTSWREDWDVTHSTKRR
jgi:glycosyltransferase involved in cell wall biosynthesis